MATRSDMERRISLGLVELPGVPGWGDPLMRQENLIEATNHVARESDAFWTYFDIDLAGSTGTPQAELCAPRGDSGELYKIKSARLTRSDNTYRLYRQGVGIVTASWMDRNFPDWRENPTSGEPDYLVVAGPDVLLYPKVTWTKTAGLRLYGFGTPGRTWDNPTEGVTGINPTDTFPLAQWAEETVVTWAKMQRCIQFPSKENMMRYPMLKELYEESLLPDTQHKATVQYGRSVL